MKKEAMIYYSDKLANNIIQFSFEYYIFKISEFFKTN